MTTTHLDLPTFRAFMDLVGGLSPENLHSDGEVSRAVANRRYRALKAKWKALEATMGRTVTEDEVWRVWAELPRALGGGKR